MVVAPSGSMSEDGMDMKYGQQSEETVVFKTDLKLRNS